MAGLFLQVAELSVSAAWMIPAVCALRLLLRRRALRRSRRPRRRRGWERIRHRAPFILGLFHPCIYLPSDLSEPELGFVLAHERCT